MLIVLVSDIHSNLVALEAVLEQLPLYDQLWCLGDTIGYGPRPNECLEYMRGLGTYVLTGNHDLACLGQISTDVFNDEARIANDWNGRQLQPAPRSFLQARAATLTTEQGTLLAHASPRDPVWEYVDRVEIATANFAHITSQVCWVGHTHVPVAFMLDTDGQVVGTYMQHSTVLQLRPDARYILNPGSVGQPRDGDPRAAYALWDTGAGTVQFARIGYDIGATQKQIAAAGLPALLGERLASGQ
jgi:diadenosine tetraphosphatase ApaH/serine/threonine PP2A family protein phosphatase